MIDIYYNIIGVTGRLNVFRITTCYLNVYPEKKVAAKASYCITLKRQAKIFGHPNCPFHMSYKFKRKDKIIKSLMLILDFSFISVSVQFNKYWVSPVLGQG